MSKQKSRFWKYIGGALALLMVVLASSLGQAQTTATTTRVSVASNGSEGNNTSNNPSISADGRFVAFESFANNLVEGDTNEKYDVFVHERQTEKIVRISVHSNGEQGNGSSGNPSISADGRYVAFLSEASNLVDADINGHDDVFLHDRNTGETSLVSLSSDNVQANARSYNQSISANGRYIAFTSLAGNLVEIDSNGQSDIFIHDIQTGQTRLVSVSSNGVQGNNWSDWPSISADGQQVAFVSFSRNLIDSEISRYQRAVFVHDRDAGETTLVSVASDSTPAVGDSNWPSISADGRYVAFYSKASNLVVVDNNGQNDVFVHDRDTGQTTLVSAASDGTQGNQASQIPSISADGQLIIFSSEASNLVEDDTNGVGDIFTHDRGIDGNPTPTPTSTPSPTPAVDIRGITTRVSITSNGLQGNSGSQYPEISSDGRYIAFHSSATNLVEEDISTGANNVFIHNRETGQTSIVSITGDGIPTNSHSSFPSISANGRFITFESFANDLVDNDSDNFLDIFIHDRDNKETSIVSVTSDGVSGNGHSQSSSISSDGRYVSFMSTAKNFVDNDLNNYLDIFVHDRETGKTTIVSRASDGTIANGESRWSSISSNGRYVLFQSEATNLVANDSNGYTDTFMHDRKTGETTLISLASDGTQSNHESGLAKISADGRFVVFESKANNLIENDENNYGQDIFIRNQETGEVAVVSVASDGTQSNQDSRFPSISADGRFIAFESFADNLVENDENGTVPDIFLHDRVTGETTLISVASDGTQGNNIRRDIVNGNPSISADGQYVAYGSLSSNLVENDTNDTADIFVYDRGKDTSEPSPTPTPTVEQVVVFIPGIAGSRLVDTVPALPPHIIWPSYAFASKDKLRLKPGLRDDSIMADVVIRRIMGVINVYSLFLNRLSTDGYIEYDTGGDPSKRTQLGCDTNQTDATLFVLPWDWRFGAVDAVNNQGETDENLSLNPNNVDLLEEYILCVLQIHPDAEITLVTHSMGWFIARTYVLENPTNHNISRHIAIAPPRLGAPQTIAMMLTGDWIPPLISKDSTRTLLEHFPGAHQLLPSQLYWDLADSPFSVNNLLTKRGDVEFSEFQQVLQDYYISPAEGDFYRSSIPFVSNMQKVYQNSAFADLNGDTSGVEYHIIYGVQESAMTTGKVVEKPVWEYPDNQLLNGIVYDLELLSGDGTVPVVSATAMNDSTNLNGNASLHRLIGDAMEHRAMMNEQTLQDCVVALLADEVCHDDASAAAVESVPVRSIKLWGVDEIYVTDGISTTQNLITTTLTLEMFPDITAKYLGNHSIMFIVTGDKQYTVNFIGQGEYFESESQYGTGGNNLRTIRFSPEPAAGQHLSLVTTEDALAEMQVDTNGDGIPEAKVEPRADLQGDVANDTTPPVVTAAYDPTTGLLVTVTDNESGVESISYTLDDTHFESYTAAVVFTDQSITSVNVIAQDKAGNFSDPVTIPVTVVASNTIYLPLITR